MPEALHPKPRDPGADVDERSRSYFQNPLFRPDGGEQGHAAELRGQLQCSTHHPAPQSKGAHVSGQGSWVHEFEQALHAWNETFIPARG